MDLGMQRYLKQVESDFIKNLKAALERAGLAIDELTERNVITARRLNQILSLTGADITLREITYLAHRLGTTPADLLRRHG